MLICIGKTGCSVKEFSLSVTIMAHVKRSKMIDELLTMFDIPAGDVRIAWDQNNNRWDTGRRSWLAHDEVTTHHMVIQDDSLPCTDIVKTVKRALAALPGDDAMNSVMCLYMGKKRPRTHYVRVVAKLASDKNASFITIPGVYWGPGIVMPTHMIKDMVSFCDQRKDIPNYDTRISRWTVARELTVYYPWPSLVEHRDAGSLVPGRVGTGRTAMRWAGTDREAVEALRWDGPVVDATAAQKEWQNSRDANERKALQRREKVVGRQERERAERAYRRTLERQKWTGSGSGSES